MPQKIADVMTPDPITIERSSPIIEAAQVMRDADVGALVVVDNAEVCGIVTDRDIAIRAVADGRDARSSSVGDICSGEVAVIESDDDVDRAVEMMRGSAVRRLPVVEDGQPVGIISLGDLALLRDRKSALAEVSAAPPNR